MKYRVLFDGTVVYARPQRWKMLYALSKGALWEGEPVRGQYWRRNPIWIKGYDGFVWSGMLEEIKETEL